MPVEPVPTPSAPGTGLPYSPAVRAGDWIVLAGQVGLDPASGELVEGGLAAQAERALRNLSAVLDAAGLSTGDVVKTTVFLVDIGDFQALNEVYARSFGDPPPARSTFAVAALPRGALVEIEAVAARRSGGV
jgi:2-iminobutanoate/2-iminopropanoate deaminase